MSAGHRSRRVVVALGTLLLVALVLPPLISLGRFRTRLSSSISAALGRPVTIGSVTLRLLPQPGFELQNFVVADEASFSAEPMLRADEVSADLRLSSLWRGRLEIAKLSLQDCSINLVRRDDGHWNLYTLLERTAHSGAAPTALKKPQYRLRFPYIEAENSRINFKIRQEKKVFAFTDADFALWQASEDQWSMRLEAHPVRTDANLSDTGTFALEGSFQRAPDLRDTPLRLTLRLKDAQLGQLSHLIYGRDRGWRGAVNLTSQLVGTPAALSVVTDADVQDFRRYDIINADFLRLRAHCSGAFSSVDQSWRNVSCRAPVGDGELMATAEAHGPLSAPTYSARVVADKVPMQAVIAAARHAKRDLPQDLTATGELNGTFSVSRTTTGTWPVWSGKGETSKCQVKSNNTGDEFALGSIAVDITSRADGNARPTRVSGHQTRVLAEVHPGLQVRLGPSEVALGDDEPATASAEISRLGYSINVEGGAQVQRALQVARTLGLSAPQAALTGAAKIDFQISGGWAGFAAPKITGKAQLRNVTAHLNGVITPLELTSATLLLDANQGRLQNLSATFPGSGMHFTGEVGFERGCKPAEGCVLHANLHADQILGGELNNLLNPRMQHRPWYRLLEGSRSSGALAHLAADGQITANRVVLAGMLAGKSAAEFAYGQKTLHLTNIRSELWDGKYSGSAIADFNSKIPSYSTEGRLEHASLAQFAGKTGGNWGTGSLFLTYRGQATGWSAPELAASLNSQGQFEIRDGMLAHVALAEDAKPLRVRRFMGEFRISKGEFNLVSGKLQSGASIYNVSGTAQLDKGLDFRMVRDPEHTFTVTGTLISPKVASVSSPQAEAAMKP